MGRTWSVQQLNELGRVRLNRRSSCATCCTARSPQAHGLTNAPDDPELAIAAGTRLCEELLEPLQERLGAAGDPLGLSLSRRLTRSVTADAEGGQAGYNCASNERNAAHHIWDIRDEDGYLGATACVVVPGFWDAHQQPGDWQILARWIDDICLIRACSSFRRCGR